MTNILQKIATLLLAFNLMTFIGISQSVNVGKVGPKGKVLLKFTDPAELKKLTENPQDSIWIVDVRSEKAYRAGHIPTAKSFPSGEIMNRLDEIPEDKYLILYCVVGGSAQIVLKKLKKSGHKRTMNWGGNLTMGMGTQFRKLKFRTNLDFFRPLNHLLPIIFV